MDRSKRILIATDFSFSTLDFVIETIQRNSKVEKLEIVLACGLKSSNAFRDFLGLDFSHNALSKYISNDFKKACEMIELHYESNHVSITADVIKMNNQFYIRQYLKNMKIDEVLITPDYTCQIMDKQAFDLKDAFKSFQPKNTFGLTSSQDNRFEEDALENLFFKKLKTS